jgi:hypothetical protein
MANIINGDNGVVSGTAGLKSSSDGTGILALQTNGTTAMSVDASQVVTLTNALPVASGGTGVTSSTGSGSVVLGTSPTLTTPTINSAQVATVSGTAPLYLCRAWINFNGTGTVAIRASGNVTSITDNGVGNYTINFTTAMPDANYSAVVTGATGDTSSVAIGGRYTTSTAAACQISNAIGGVGGTDVAVISVAIFR